MKTATYNRKPTFQVLDTANGLDIIAVNHKGYWVSLGIDGTENDARPDTVLSLNTESTSA